ncbi:MAG TPA: hypothetical protein VNO23_04150 [Candidatus Binatia bacterium]|nr:hypothetical protein [Candidatus Binatia bacterium]
MLADCRYETGEALRHPAIVRTYHDLFRNVGYGVGREEVFRGVKDGVPQTLLVPLFVRPGDRGRDDDGTGG